MPLSSIDIFLSRPRSVLVFLGIWLPPKKYALLYAMYKILVMLTQYSFILFEFIYVVVVWGDLDEMSEASYLLFTQATVCYKVTVFIVNKNNFIDLLDYMKLEIFASLTPYHNKILFTNARKIKNLCAVFLVTAIMTVSLWAIMPLFDKEEARLFPFKIWMPVNPQKSLQYELGYIYQIMSIYCSAMLFFSVDSTILSMVMFGCSQLEIIIEKIKELQHAPLSAKWREEKYVKIIKENNRLLVECLRQHQTVIRFIELLENTYHANIFFQLCATVGIICIIGLRISIAEPSSVQFYSMLNYMATMLSQLFLYCWCGSELTTKEKSPHVSQNAASPTPILHPSTTHTHYHNLYDVSAPKPENHQEDFIRTVLQHAQEVAASAVPWAAHNYSLFQSQDLRECLYQSPWHEQDAKFNRSLLVAMERMKRPIILKAGHYIPLSRPTFVSILRSSYSYFAVLNQANNK